MGLVDSGSLDRQVTLSHRVVTQNAYGEQVPSWPSAYATVWAKRADLTGTKRVIAQQFMTQQTTEFMIRFRDDVVMTDRLQSIEEGLSFEILQMSLVGRHEGINLLCRAVVP